MKIRTKNVNYAIILVTTAQMRILATIVLQHPLDHSQLQQTFVNVLSFTTMLAFRCVLLVLIGAKRAQRAHNYAFHVQLALFEH